MANLPLTFAGLLGAAMLIDAGLKGDSIANVITGQATHHPLAGGGGGSSSSSSASSTPAAAGQYVNPVPGAVTGRIDQGVDYTLGKAGFLAPGRSKILISDQSNSGWGGGGYVAGQLLDGPLAGQVWYAAEGAAPTVTVGQVVQAGQNVARKAMNPYNGIIGNIEGGWADPHSPGRPLAQTLRGYAGDQSAAGLTAGYSFSQFVTALGGVAGEFQGAGTQLEHTIAGEFAGGNHPTGVPF